ASPARRPSWPPMPGWPPAPPPGSCPPPTAGSPAGSTSLPRRPSWTRWPPSTLPWGVTDMLRTLSASLRSHWVRLAMTALAVALGTGLMAGSFVFTATLTHSLDSLFAQAAAGTDVEVRHVSPPGAVQGAGSARGGDRRATGCARPRRPGQRPGRAARPGRQGAARAVRGRAELACPRAVPGGVHQPAGPAPGRAGAGHDRPRFRPRRSLRG